MKYMLMLFADEKAGGEIPAEQMAEVMKIMSAYADALKKAGVYVMDSALQRTPDARTLRMQGGEMIQAGPGNFINDGGELQVHDGPYAETREQLGGIYIIEAASMAEALDWAAKCPAAQWGPIEVRQMLTGL